MAFYRGMTCENVTLKGDGGTPITAAEITQGLDMFNGVTLGGLTPPLTFAAGKDHPRIPDALLQEARELPGFWELPHFRSALPEGTTENPHRQASPQSR